MSRLHILKRRVTLVLGWSSLASVYIPGLRRHFASVQQTSQAEERLLSTILLKKGVSIIGPLSTDKHYLTSRMSQWTAAKNFAFSRGTALFLRMQPCEVDIAQDDVVRGLYMILIALPCICKCIFSSLIFTHYSGFCHCSPHDCRLAKSKNR